ncbi:outer membrane protein assembly factor BamD [Simiduia agarivorans]|uniref:Outer membrane protein assembly factor BamD n=1 Tax=Simiduia agarivorans (strain DSM 21679 / JCM 13881 / BCRC 17597 / SA1) TaxID=1117647 RepID=K4KR05_SIMAS|nr:outer membrane protein assembly factor BamD [Simiduia agarivorans]AFV00671.1 competence protein ComL [Simiduia agarivorans SA1 = DSM 21679]
MSLRRIISSTLVLTAVLLAACASNEPKHTTEKDFYDAAQRMLNASQWEPAIKNLQLLEENFPFGAYAEQAQLELIYAYYKSNQPEAAMAAADRFIRLHPQHRNVDYAYYMKGLTTFTQNQGMFERYVPSDLTDRDPGAARESFAHFAQLIARYPDSQYAQDARKRMIHLRNLLARYEIHVANYYFKRGAYLAAANRGRYVVENFQQTPAVPDALAVMAQGYHLLGMDDLAQSAVEVLWTNFPDYPNFDKNGNFNYQYSVDINDRSWLNLLSFGLFDKQDLRGFDTRAKYNPAVAVFETEGALPGSN